MRQWMDTRCMAGAVSRRMSFRAHSRDLHSRVVAPNAWTVRLIDAEMRGGTTRARRTATTADWECGERSVPRTPKVVSLPFETARVVRVASRASRSPRARCSSVVLRVDQLQLQMTRTRLHSTKTDSMWIVLTRRADDPGERARTQPVGLFTTIGRTISTV
jgi:hypothetical protein